MMLCTLAGYLLLSTNGKYKSVIIFGILVIIARLCLHELSGIMALSQRRGCHHGEITASA